MQQLNTLPVCCVELSCTVGGGGDFLPSNSIIIIIVWLIPRGAPAAHHTALSLISPTPPTLHLQTQRQRQDGKQAEPRGAAPGPDQGGRRRVSVVFCSIGLPPLPPSLHLYAMRIINQSVVQISGTKERSRSSSSFPSLPSSPQVHGQCHARPGLLPPERQQQWRRRTRACRATGCSDDKGRSRRSSSGVWEGIEGRGE